MIATVNSSLQNLNASLAKLASGEKKFSIQNDFVSKLVDSLNAVTNRALPELKDRYAAIGTEIAGGSAMEFAAYIKTEHEKWARVIKISGAKAE